MTNTKEHIIKTSLYLFLQKSYRDVTMKEIVKKTGLSKGAFYHYFTSKEELFREIVHLFFSMGVIDYSKFNQKSLKAFYSDYLTYIDLSFKEIYRLFDSSEEEKTSFNFFFIMFEAISKLPEFLEMELEQFKRSLSAWKKVIKKSKENKEISSSSSDTHIAKLFLYCTDGVFIRYMNNERKMTYKALLAESFNTIYQNLRI